MDEGGRFLRWARPARPTLCCRRTLIDTQIEQWPFFPSSLGKKVTGCIFLSFAFSHYRYPFSNPSFCSATSVRVTKRLFPCFMRVTQLNFYGDRKMRPQTIRAEEASRPVWTSGLWSRIRCSALHDWLFRMVFLSYVGNDQILPPNKT